MTPLIVGRLLSDSSSQVHLKTVALPVQPVFYVVYESARVLAMAVMLDIVSVCAQCETFICRPCVHGLQSVTSGDSLNVGQVVVRQRDSKMVCHGEGIPKRVLEYLLFNGVMLETSRSDS